MNTTQSSRRRFLISALTFSTLAMTGTSWLRSSAAWAASGENATLTRFARLLFPHDGLSDATYAEVMASVLTSLAANPASGGMLSAAEAALNGQQEQDWFDLDEAAQIAAIENIQGEAFFTAILETARGAFYYNPQVWSYLDYPGSSKEHGGYKYRGFDNIDWLPEQG
jgi:hypothetical protein